MFTITDVNGNNTGIYFTSERDAMKDRRAGEKVVMVPRKSRGYLHNDID